MASIEQARLTLSKATEPWRQSQLGQFFTPAGIAGHMSDLFRDESPGNCRLLDAGAGIGSLSAAFLNRCTADGLRFRHIHVDAFEIDERLHPNLVETLERFHSLPDFTATVRGKDFIHTAVDSLCGDLFTESLPKYTHAILNPPYKKIRSNSAHRAALRQVQIETVNLYSAFVALALLLLEDRGELVAIIPRSFCNGPYYRPFRQLILEHSAIRHMHLFASRTKAFKDDDVLQENVIIKLERGAPQGTVTIGTSTDDSFDDIQTHEYAFDQIVSPTDSERFIHVPTSPTNGSMSGSPAFQSTLDALGVQVSTGPVVDFRLKEYLRAEPEATTVPLLYPAHFNGWTTHWPRLDIKKPNAIARTAETEKWLYPNGFYCLVRRFSSKEEKRRGVASVVEPGDFPDAEVLGFENHLNVFHANRHGLPKAMAHGLAVFLNSTSVDESFRRFNGHTQVNATDLRQMKYPNKEKLIALGEWAMHCGKPDQAQIDERVESLCA